MDLSEAINIVINECTGESLARRCDKAYRECQNIKNQQQINTIIIDYIDRILSNPNEIVNNGTGFEFNLFTDKTKDIWLRSFRNGTTCPAEFRNKFLNLFNTRLELKIAEYNSANKNIEKEKALKAQSDFSTFKKARLEKDKEKIKSFKTKIYG